ncbi:MAG: M23 family metallopeptidase [Thermodesulfobacteriota bacterium]
MILLLIAGLLGTSIYFGTYFKKYQNMYSQFENSQKTVRKQKVQLISLSKKLGVLEDDLSKIKKLDSKLRVMANLESNQAFLSNSLGGPEIEDISEAFLSSHRQELLARKMHNFLDELSTDAKLEEMRQRELMDHLKNKKQVLASTPSIWPTQGWISSDFGYRDSPFTGRREFHKGLDISGPSGTPIYAPANAEVVFCGKDGGYGICVVLDHGHGLKTRYGHLSRYSVEPGQQVERGQLLGYIGNTGRSTGPHLHYEVRNNGVPVNPMRYILN